MKKLIILFLLTSGSCFAMDNEKKDNTEILDAAAPNKNTKHQQKKELLLDLKIVSMLLNNYSFLFDSKALSTLDGSYYHDIVSEEIQIKRNPKRNKKRLENLKKHREKLKQVEKIKLQELENILYLVVQHKKLMEDYKTLHK